MYSANDKEGDTNKAVVENEGHEEGETDPNTLNDMQICLEGEIGMLCVCAGILFNINKIHFLFYFLRQRNTRKPRSDRPVKFFFS